MDGTTAGGGGSGAGTAAGAGGAGAGGVGASGGAGAMVGGGGSTSTMGGGGAGGVCAVEVATHVDLDFTTSDSTTGLTPSNCSSLNGVGGGACGAWTYENLQTPFLPALRATPADNTGYWNPPGNGAPQMLTELHGAFIARTSVAVHQGSTWPNAETNLGGLIAHTIGMGPAGAGDWLKLEVGRLEDIGAGGGTMQVGVRTGWGRGMNMSPNGGTIVFETSPDPVIVDLALCRSESEVIQRFYRLDTEWIEVDQNSSGSVAPPTDFEPNLEVGLIAAAFADAQVVADFQRVRIKEYSYLCDCRTVLEAGSQ